MNVMVLGGYGNFGALVSRSLASIPGMSVVVAGRDGAAAAGLARELGAGALAVDVAAPDLARRLREARCDWVVNTVGPFQGATHHVPREAISAGVHYVDLADAREYVCGIVALEDAARAAGVAVVSGASSVPALSSAVVDRYAGEFEELHEIHVAIASSAKPPGTATVAGALRGCGRRFSAWREGRWTQVGNWRGWRRHRFAAGFATWLADCDAPDLELLPARYPGVRTVTFAAGAGSTLSQAVLASATFLPEGALAPRANVLHAWASRLAPLGTSRSGMCVALSGPGTDGKIHHVCWELTAARHEGRRVPCMGAVALLRKALARRPPAPGARPCVGLLDLGEYLAEVRDFVEVRVSRGAALHR